MTIVLLLIYVFCVLLGAAGLWLVVYRRGTQAPEKLNVSQWLSGLIRWRANASSATRLVVGLCLLVGAYHLAAYAGPPEWFGLRVPRERWPLLAGAIGLALAGSLASDRLEARGAARDVAGDDDAEQ